MSWDKYKVRGCPLCGQDWAVILKDKMTQDLYVYCAECESQWESPMQMLSCSNNVIDDDYTEAEIPSFEEICNNGWDKYLNYKKR